MHWGPAYPQVPNFLFPVLACQSARGKFCPVSVAFPGLRLVGAQGPYQGHGMGLPTTTPSGEAQ